jgi:multidrug resistance efflux pump
MRGKWLLISGFAVIAGVGGGALSHRFHKAPPPTQARTPAAVLNIDEITITGRIRAQHVTGVGASIEGNLEAFLADVGDEVFEGQVLARVGSSGLETSREQASAAVEYAQQQVSSAETAVNSARMEASRADADLERARLQVDRAQKVFERQTTLNRSGATPKLKYEAAVQEFEAAVKDFEISDKAARAAHDGVQGATDKLAIVKKTLTQRSEELEDAQGAFQAAEVRAPVAGIIVGRKGELGKSARDSGDQLFQIATDLFTLEVVADPKSADLKRIHPGQQALVLVLDLQSAGMPGVVKAIQEPEVIVEFNNSIAAIKPGMRADVRIKLD